MSFWIDATCLSGTLVIASVDDVSGLAVTASMLRTTAVPAASDLAVCWNTSTDVTPASTACCGTACQA